MDQSCNSPLTPERIRAFDAANALTAQASRQIVAGNLFQAARLYERAADVPGLTDGTRKELLLVAAELLLELYAIVRPMQTKH